VFIADSASTTGAGLANLTHSSSGLVASYIAGDLSNDVQITLATATLGTFTSGGFVAVDNTNMPGWYEIGIPNAALDGGNEVAIHLRGAANMVPVNIYIELDAFDYQTATQPVNVTQFGGTSGTFASGRPDVTVASYASGQAPLQPTTAGRTLDVTATGAAAIDWANIENATATNQFSGSYIALQNNQNVNLNDGAITAAKFAANAITASALAADAATEIGAATLTALGTGTWATAIPWNAAWDAEVQSECADAITAAGVMTGTYTAPDNATIGTINTKLGSPAGASLAADIAAVKTDTGNLVTRITSTLFSGITYLSRWLGAMAGKTADSTTLTEMQATTAGASYNNTTDSLEGVRDRGDAAWTTATGFATPANVTDAANAIRGTDNDTLKTLSEQIDGIEGGGNTTVTVLPATGIVANRSAGVTLLPVVGETISQAITVYQSDGTTAVNLSGKTLQIIFETMSGTDVATVNNANISVGGTGSNVVTFAYPSAVTASERTLRFALRDAAAPLTMYLQGVCSVVAAPKADT